MDRVCVLNKKLTEDTVLTLASASPRRKDILSRAWSGRLKVFPSGVTEDTWKTGELASTYAVKLAAAKALSLEREPELNLVLGADTVVELDGQVMGKPHTYEEAVEMLSMLRGRCHTVTTGLTIADNEFREIVSGHESSMVYVRQYLDTEIEEYVASGQPFDKAGGYAIQDLKFAPVHHLDGCHLNVVGLPLCRLFELLQDLGTGVEQLLNLYSCTSCREGTDISNGVTTI